MNSRINTVALPDQSVVMVGGRSAKGARRCIPFVFRETLNNSITYL
jgi:hypothetical protein